MIKYEKWLMALIMLAAVALFLIAGKAFAGTATVSFTAPTLRTDGSPITGALTYRYEVGTCPSLATINHTMTQAATSYTVTLPPGTYCFRVFAIEAGGGTSGPSNIPTKTITIAPPVPLIITISSNGYVLKQWSDGRKVFSLAGSGSVPLGIACEPLPGLTGYGLADGKVAICGPG
jgi:hypothetical protein